MSILLENKTWSLTRKVSCRSTDPHQARLPNKGLHNVVGIVKCKCWQRTIKPSVMPPLCWGGLGHWIETKTVTLSRRPHTVGITCLFWHLFWCYGQRPQCSGREPTVCSGAMDHSHSAPGERTTVEWPSCCPGSQGSSHSPLWWPSLPELKKTASSAHPSDHLTGGHVMFLMLYQENLCEPTRNPHGPWWALTHKLRVVAL